MSVELMTPEQVEELRRAVEIADAVGDICDGLAASVRVAASCTLWESRHEILASLDLLAKGVEGKAFSARGVAQELTIEVEDERWDAARATVGSRVLVVPLPQEPTDAS